MAQESQTNGGGELGIGPRLRAARERAGLSVIEAAERLHMEPRMVEALDTEAFGVLGAPVYARGHLRRYAELVGESAGDLQALYAASLAGFAPPDLRQVPHRERLPETAARTLAAPLAVGLAVLAFVGVLGWMLRAARQPHLSRPLGSSTPPVSASAPTPALVSQAPLATSIPAVQARSEPASGTARAAKDASAAAAAAAAAPGVSAGRAAALPVSLPAVPASVAPPLRAPAGSPGTESAALELDLKFATDSWTEVYDADGRRLFYDIAAANTERTLAGKAPLRVVLGHAPGVSVSINGRVAAIPPTALHSDVADFVVSAAGRLASSR